MKERKWKKTRGGKAKEKRNFFQNVLFS